jgi:hypothetical protein
MSYFRPNNPLIRHTRVERNKLPEANLLPAAHTELINKSREDEIGLNKDYCGARINVCSVKEYVCVCVYTSGCCCSRGGCINNFTLFSDFVQLQKAARRNTHGSMLAAMTIKRAASACDSSTFYCCTVARFMLESVRLCHWFLKNCTDAARFLLVIFNILCGRRHFCWPIK